MRIKEQPISPQQLQIKPTIYEGNTGMGYFSVLGADDESDDHASLGEPLFDSDAEFSDGENVEGALEEALEGTEGQEAKEDHGMGEHAGSRWPRR